MRYRDFLFIFMLSRKEDFLSGAMDEERISKSEYRQVSFLFVQKV
jgi:hypothetical protein